MSRGGATFSTAPTGWAYLTSGCTIRWQRGDDAAYVLRGNQVGKWSTAEDVVGKIPVSRLGWGDLSEVKLIGETWVRGKHVRCPMCGKSK